MARTAFESPASDRWFEDYHAGDIYLFGPINITTEEIIAFARRYDPQAIHIDPTAAKLGPYDGLIASGWMTLGLMMRLLVENYVSTCAALASPGVDEVRWLTPVRPGDALRLRVTIRSTRVSRSKPDRGVVICLMEAINQNGECAAKMTATGMVRLRSRQPRQLECRDAPP